MQSLSTMRGRLSAVCLGIGTILFYAGLTHPEADPVSPAAVVSSSAWRLGHLGMIAGHILLVFGVLGIYAILARTRAERPAFVGMVASLVGLGLQLPGFGMLAIALPVLGEQQATGPIVALLNSPFLAIFLGIGSLCLAGGAVLLTVAIGRSGRLSLLAAIIYTVGSVLLIPEPVLGQIGRAAVGGLILVGTLWLAGALWQQVTAAAPVTGVGDRRQGVGQPSIG